MMKAYSWEPNVKIDNKFKELLTARLVEVEMAEEDMQVCRKLEGVLRAGTVYIWYHCCRKGCPADRTRPRWLG